MNSIGADFVELYPDLDSAQKIMVAMLRILNSPIADNPESPTDGILVSKALAEWLIMPAMIAAKVLWGVQPRKLASWGATNIPLSGMKKRLSERLPQHSSKHDIRQNHLLDELYSVATELAVFRYFKSGFPVEDLFTQTFVTSTFECVKDRSLSTVFAAQAFLDIKFIMGSDVSKGFNDLVHFQKNLTKAFQVSNIERSCGQVMEDLKNWVNTDYAQNMKDRFCSTIPPEVAAELKQKYPPATPFSLLKQHPLLCGMVLFGAKTALQGASLQDANDRISIVACVHLHNAMQEKQLMSQRWEDLDYVLEAHHEGELFLGSPPKTLNGFIRHWAIVNGVSATFFASTLR